jgi:hypothetical protein
MFFIVLSGHFWGFWTSVEAVDISQETSFFGCLLGLPWLFGLRGPENY